MSIRAIRWAYGLFEVIDIPPAERSVLLALCWDHTDTNGCYPSQDRIALLSGYRRRKVCDCLNSLEGMGFIKRQTARKGGKFQQTRYRLFGTCKIKPCADGGTRHRVHKKAHGDRVQTGAQYRGTNNRGFDCEDVVEFPIQKNGTSGGGNV